MPLSSVGTVASRVKTGRRIIKTLDLPRKTPCAGLIVLVISAAMILGGCGTGNSDRVGNESVPDAPVLAATPTRLSPSPVEVTPATAGTPTNEVQETATPAPAAVDTSEEATPTATTDPTPVTPSPTAVEEAREPRLDARAVQAMIEDSVAGIDGQVAVVLAAADGTVLFELNGYESMEAASLYKMPIMVELFRQFETGEVDREAAVLVTASYFAEGADSTGYEAHDTYVSIETLLFAMIAQSSNVAAYALLDLVGNTNVNATMAGLGLDGIEIRWSPRHIPPAEILPEVLEEIEEFVEQVVDPDDVEDNGGESPEDDPEDEPTDDEDEQPAGLADPRAGWLGVTVPVIAPTLRADEAFNVVSAADMAGLLVQILNGQVVSQQASAEMLDLLARQQIPGGLAGQLPAGVVAHKTGYLEDGVVNDAGIISTPSGQFVAVVLTEGVREDIAYLLMSNLGRMLYEIEPE